MVSLHSLLTQVTSEGYGPSLLYTKLILSIKTWELMFIKIVNLYKTVITYNINQQAHEVNHDITEFID